MSTVSVYHDGEWIREIHDGACPAEVAGRCLPMTHDGRWRTAKRRNDGGWDVSYHLPTDEEELAWDNRTKVRERGWMEHAHG